MKLRKMSLAVIAAAGLISLASSVRAEDPAPTAPIAPPSRRGGGQRLSAEEQLKMYTEKLKLTAEQQPKVKVVIEERAKKTQELRGSGTPREEMRAKVAAITDETHKKMKEILTADQFKQYEEIEKQFTGARRNGPAAAAPADDGAKQKKAE